MISNKVDGVIRVPSSLPENFFIYWIKFLKPFHSLTTREEEVVAALLRLRYELAQKISDDKIIGQVLFNEEYKQRVREICELSFSHYQVILGNLRKKGIVVNGDINSRFIPKIKEGEKQFKLLLLFEL